MKMGKLSIINPKRGNVRIPVGTKKMWSLSTHWMMKPSSQKQVLAVHREMVRSKNLPDWWLAGENVCSGALLRAGKNLLGFCCVSSAAFLLVQVKLILNGSHITLIEPVPQEGYVLGISLSSIPVLASETSPSVAHSQQKAQGEGSHRILLRV